MLNINLLTKKWDRHSFYRKRKIGLIIVVLMMFIMSMIGLFFLRSPVPLPPKSIINQSPVMPKKLLSPFLANDVDFDNVSIQKVLRVLAQRGGFNVMISPNLSGTITLHMHNMPVEKILESVLQSQHLIKYRDHGVWMIMSYAETLEKQQEKIKLQQASEDIAFLMTHVWQIHYTKADSIVHVLQSRSGSLLSKRGYIHCDARTNRIIVRDTPSKMKEIALVIQQLDIPVQQVLIEARLASVDSDFERELGIHFAVISPSQKARVGSAGRYSLAVATLADGSLLDMQLVALERQGHGELISSPSLFTANQQAASIEAGEEIPYQEVSQSGATGVVFKKAVLSLKVTPQILPHGKVLLQLQVNQDKPSQHLVLGVPTIDTRQISTNVLVGDQQTIVLGGIFESNRDSLTENVPFLGKIPLVGWLFRQHNVIANKRELLIFVTPKIINTLGDVK